MSHHRSRQSGRCPGRNAVQEGERWLESVKSKLTDWEGSPLRAAVKWTVVLWPHAIWTVIWSVAPAGSSVRVKGADEPEGVFPLPLTEYWNPEGGVPSKAQLQLMACELVFSTACVPLQLLRRPPTGPLGWSMNGWGETLTETCGTMVGVPAPEAGVPLGAEVEGVTPGERVAEGVPAPRVEWALGVATAPVRPPTDAPEPGCAAVRTYALAATRRASSRIRAPARAAGRRRAAGAPV